MSDLPALLLVDDDPMISESLAFVLRESFEVSTADTRERARSVMLRMDSMPRLALVDLGLPPATQLPEEGFTLISELLAINPIMKILVLSGQSDRSNVQHALTLGAVDFIPKPCDVDFNPRTGVLRLAIDDPGNVFGTIGSSDPGCLDTTDNVYDVAGDVQDCNLVYLY